MKEARLKGKLFTFVPFDEWGKSWDETEELSVGNALDKKFAFGTVRYYGLGGFKGLVALEPASETEDCLPDYDEQLEAAEYGCNIIYEYIK